MVHNIKIGKFIIGDGHPTLIIAETACAHNGSFEEAKQLIDAAVDGDADIIHFIVLKVDAGVSPRHPDYGLLKTLEFSPEQWKKLILYAKSKKILVATTFEDDPSLELVSRLPVDVLKIHSTDNTNPEIMKKAAHLKKPIMISVGAMSFEEIDKAIKTIKGEGNDDIILMYGYQNYPTDPAKINMRLMSSLKEKFNLPVGYADHTDGDSPLAFSIPLLAIPLGANVIDKHINLDRKSKGVDYEASLNPDEFKEFVRSFRLIQKALGDGIRHAFTEDENKYRVKVKKSIVAAKDLEKNTTLKREDLEFLRSNELGLSPSEVDLLVGKKLKKSMKKLDNILPADVAKGE